MWRATASGTTCPAATAKPVPWLVAINSVFQILAFGLLGWFYLQVLPGWFGLDQVSAGFSVGTIVLSVLVFLGIPLLARVPDPLRRGETQVLVGLVYVALWLRRRLHWPASTPTGVEASAPALAGQHPDWCGGQLVSTIPEV